MSDSVDRAAELNKGYGIKVDVGYVYVLKAENGLYKIGKTHNLQSRLSNIRTASPLHLEIYRVFKCVNCGYAESDLHDFYSDFREKGEWFRLGNKQLEDLEKWADELYLCPCYL